MDNLFYGMLTLGTKSGIYLLTRGIAMGCGGAIAGRVVASLNKE
jgi:hypothetical protein